MPFPFEHQESYEFKELKKEVAKIKSAVGFLLPPQIKDQNYKPEKGPNIFDGLMKKIQESDKRRDQLYKDKIAKIEEKINENQAQIALLKEKIEVLEKQKIQSEKIKIQKKQGKKVIENKVQLIPQNWEKQMNLWKEKWKKKEQQINRMQRRNIASSSEYQGNWQNWKIHGLGIMRWNDGNKYEGEWKDGKCHGKGTYYYTNGDWEYGDYANDNPHGYIIYHHKSGKVEERFYENGKLKKKIDR